MKPGETGVAACGFNGGKSATKKGCRTGRPEAAAGWLLSGNAQAHGPAPMPRHLPAWHPSHTAAPARIAPGSVAWPSD